jgi:hypothetical protein
MKTTVTGLWITTAIIVFGIGSGGAAEPVHLGHPVSFVTIIFVIIAGFSSVLGAVALPAPGSPRLRDGGNGPGHLHPRTGARQHRTRFGRRVPADGCVPRLGKVHGCFPGAATAKLYGWSPVSATEKSRERSRS